MDIDETKQVKLKDKPMMTLLEAAEFTGIGRHKLCELSDKPDCEFEAMLPNILKFGDLYDIIYCPKCSV